MSSSPITLSGLTSGIDTNSIIQQLIAIERRPIDLLRQRVLDINQQNSAYNAIKSKVSDLKGSLSTLTDAFNGSAKFNSKTAKSSNENLVTAQADTTATTGTYTLDITNRATATRASSSVASLPNGIGAVATGASTLASVYPGNITSGNFTLYVNGAANTISVDAATDTVNDVLGRIQGVAGITGASVTAQGKLQITFNGGTNVQIGSTGDTTNFLKSTGLDIGTADATSITGGKNLTTFSTSAAIDTAGANLAVAVTAGSQFRIGAVTIDTTGKSLNSIISEINASVAGVTASYNASSNRLEFLSKTTGSALIDMQDTAGNFLTAMGLVVGGDSTASQTAGQNANFILNGANYTSASNTVDSTVTGLTGVTFNLLSQSPGNPATVTITKNTADLSKAMQNFVISINAVITAIDTQTDSKSDLAQLKSQSGLLRFRNELRSITSDAIAGAGSIVNPSQIGLSTGAVSGASSSTPSQSFQFNESTFLAAFSSNPVDVENAIRGATGVFTRLQASVDFALKDDTNPALDGLFANRVNSSANQIKALNESIARGEERLTKRESFLRRQFQQMEAIMARAQQQSAQLSSFSAQLAANRGG